MKIKRQKLFNIVANVGIAVIISSGFVYGAVKSQIKTTAQDEEYPVIEIQTETQTEDVKAYLIPDRDNMPYITDCDLSFSGYDFIPLDEELQTEIYELCQDYEIAYELVLAIIKTESQFTVEASSTTGDYGLMQINKSIWNETAVKLGFEEYSTDPVQNIEMGMFVFNKCLNEYAHGNLTMALNYYNSGAPEEIEYADGTSYSSRVYANYEWIENELKMGE